MNFHNTSTVSCEQGAGFRRLAAFFFAVLLAAAPFLYPASSAFAHTAGEEKISSNAQANGSESGNIAEKTLDEYEAVALGRILATPQHTSETDTLGTRPTADTNDVWDYLQPNMLPGAFIVSGSIGAAQIADESITTDKLETGLLTEIQKLRYFSVNPQGGVAIGGGARAYGSGIAIGGGAVANDGSVVIGEGAVAEHARGIAVGSGAVSYNGGAAIGSNALGKGPGALALGRDSAAVGGQAAAFGAGSRAGGNSLAYGGCASAGGIVVNEGGVVSPYPDSPLCGEIADGAGGTTTAIGEGTLAVGAGQTAGGYGPQRAVSQAAVGESGNLPDGTLVYVFNTGGAASEFVGATLEQVGASERQLGMLESIGTPPPALAAGAAEEGGDAEAPTLWGYLQQDSLPGSFIEEGTIQESALDETLLISLQSEVDANGSAERSTEVGFLANASAKGATAFGYDAGATDLLATAIGNGTRATGAWGSTAIGAEAEASGVSSIAIGRQSDAAGQGSVAIGQASDAAAEATAVGQDADADARSVALGRSAEAKASGTGGDEAVAIGYKARATGRYSIAIGSSDSASVTDYGAEAKQIDTIAIGREAVADEQSSIAIGRQARVSAATSFHSSIALGHLSTAYGGATLALGAFANTYGQQSVAVGYQADAGRESVALGYAANARGRDSIAIGAGVSAGTTDSLIVIGKGTHTLRFPALGSSATGGSNSAADTDYVVAVGTDGTLKRSAKQLSAVGSGGGGGGTIADGSITKAKLDYEDVFTAGGASAGTSVVIGRGTTVGSAATQRVTIIGDRARVDEQGGVAIGYQARAGKTGFVTSWASVAVGRDATTQGAAVAVGASTDAKYAATAIGYDAEVSQPQGIAFGAETRVSGQRGTAFGYQSTARGEESLALGAYANTFADKVIALGVDSAGVGDSAIAIGYQANATGVRSMAIGAGVTASADDLIVLGGSGHTVRIPALGGSATAAGTDFVLAVGADGTLKKSSATISGLGSGGGGFDGGGTQSAQLAGGTAVGDRSLAVGKLSAAGTQIEPTPGTTITIGHGSTAVGIGALALGDDSTAFGQNAVAGGHGAIAIGSDATASNDDGSGVPPTDAIALGNGATAAAVGSIAIGAGVTVTTENLIVLGTRTHALRIPALGATGGSGASAAGDSLVTVDNDGNLRRSGRTLGSLSSDGGGGGGVPLGPGTVTSEYIVDGTITAADLSATVFSFPGGLNTSVGEGARTLSDHATAVGRMALARGTHTVALGAGATADTAAFDGAVSGNATALGAGANAGAVNATAVGASATAAHPNAIAIGFGVRATAADQIIIGRPASTLRIPALQDDDIDGGDGTDGIGFVFADGDGDVSKRLGALVSNLSVSGTTLTVDYSDGSTDTTGTVMLPSGGGGGGFAGGGTDSILLGSGDATASGQTSIAIGDDAKATRLHSIAIGTSAEASGSYSVAIGQGAEADGQHSVAIGTGARAAGPSFITLGTSSYTVRIPSLQKRFGLGNPDHGFVYADDTGDLARRPGTLVSNVTIAGGTLTVEHTYGSAATTETTLDLPTGGGGGGGTIADGSITRVKLNYADIFGADRTVVGEDARALSAHATAIGRETVAQGENSSAFGAGANAVATYLHRLPGPGLRFETRISGNATALGGGSVANTTNATAIGAGSSTSFWDSTVVGAGATALREDTVALGAGAKASRLAAIAIGHDSHAGGARSIAIGREANAQEFADAIVIGDGVSATAGSQIILGGQSHTLRISSLQRIPRHGAEYSGFVYADGDGDILKHPGSLVSDVTESGGTLTITHTNGTEDDITTTITLPSGGGGGGFAGTGADSILLGGGTATASGARSIAIGFGAQATQLETIAIGDGARATRAGGIAIGDLASSTGEHSVAIGTAASSSGTRLITLGTGMFTVRIPSLGFASGAQRSGFVYADGDGDLSGRAGTLMSNVTITDRTLTFVHTNGTETSETEITVPPTATVGTGGELMDGSVTTGHIADGTIQRIDLNLDSVFGGTGTGSIAISPGSGALSASATSQDSIAIGRAASAAGSQSIAVGRSGSASALEAVAVGFSADADGLRSIAVGSDASAQGTGSIAIGHRSEATSGATSYAVAIGFEADAAGWRSVAVGGSSDARAVDSVAVGYQSNAEGRASLVFGKDAYAGGGGGIAVGFSANATGEDSIAIGNGVRADGPDLIVLGHSDHTLRVPALGGTATAAGTDVVLAVDADGNLKRSDTAISSLGSGGGGGELTSGSVTSDHIRDGTIQREDLNLGSVFKGGGEHSIALGGGAQALGVDSIAIGRDSKAAREESRSIAIGWEADSSGYRSVSIGAKSYVGGAESVAIGYESNADNRYTFAAGKNAYAGGRGAFALGFETRANEAGSVAIGYRAGVSGEDGIAIGNGVAAAARQIVLGRADHSLRVPSLGGGVGFIFTDADGDVSRYAGTLVSGVTESGGTVTVTSTDGSATTTTTFAVGSGGGGGTIADGSITKRKLDYEDIFSLDDGRLDAVVLGRDIVLAARGDLSRSRVTLIGDDIRAEGSGITAVGHGARIVRTSLSDVRAVAVGVSSTAHGSSTAVGYGANAISFATTAFGYLSSATGGRAVALGTQANATGSRSTAFGFFTKALGGGSIAFGSTANAFADNAIAFGHRATGLREESIAIGHQANAAGARSIAIGAGVTAAADNLIVLGTASHTLRIPALGGTPTAAGADFVLAVGADGTLKKSGRTISDLASGGGGGGGGGGSLTTAQEEAIESVGDRPDEQTGTVWDAILALQQNGVLDETGDDAPANASEAPPVQIGFGSHAEGDGDVAIGRNAIVGAHNSTAIGDNTFVNGMDSVAIGESARACADGDGDSITGCDSAVAIGQGAAAVHANSIAIGRGAVTTKRDQVVFAPLADAGEPLQFVEVTANGAIRRASSMTITVEGLGDGVDGDYEVVPTGKFAELEDDLQGIVDSGIGSLSSEVRKLQKGAAVSAALSTLNLYAQGDKRFSVSAGMGFADDETAFATGIGAKVVETEQFNVFVTGKFGFSGFDSEDSKQGGGSLNFNF